ncbi:MAG: hypothetical protein WAN72_06885 [Candidatus Acidiferrales bacterium]
MHMVRRYWITCVSVFPLVFGACSHAPESSVANASEVDVPDAGSVSFDLAPVAGVTDSSQWIASYRSQGRIARFRIELGQQKPFEQQESPMPPVTTGVGQFVAEQDSDPSALLIDLQKALEAKEFPKRVEKVKALPFKYLNFGANLSHAPTGGGMFADPPGNWTSMKIFLGTKQQEADLFLNINPVTRKGEFAIKDPEYGDRVLAQLAKIL